MRHGLAFALGYLRHPRRVGAIAPASKALAQAILHEVMRAAPNTLIEVGAGTGAITRALLPALAQADRFMVIERDPGFAQLLRRAFPDLEVLNHCATRLDTLDIVKHSPVTVVSSLPLLSMTRDEAHGCIDAMVTLIEGRPGSRLIQYTYASPHLRPFKDIPVGWRWRRAASIWANLPPATVWTLEQASHPSHTHNGFH
ncbi:MAG: rRNA adenine N-6-methyltransferase family protein [Hydrogenophaga sp.]|nr:rRNA adenine N-6-methyltransferase family protein [Hydrogenophaga sp.]MDP3626832.1 rRNA adenine N-6-methyltransferase family protein [Hydrogenophaga sp.]